MKLALKGGDTDVTVNIFVQDTSQTDGSGLTTVAHSDVTAYYARARGAATSITMVNLASATAAHSDGGWEEIDATNMPGVYRFDLPDAAIASGVDHVTVMIKGATNMAPVPLEIQLTGVDLQAAQIDANVTQISADTTAADNAELFFDGTGYAGGTTKLDVNVAQISTDATAADNCELFFDGTGYAGGTAKLDVNVAQISGTAAAADNLEALYNVAIASGTTEGTQTTTSFDTDLAEATNDHYNNMVVVFTSGTLAGQARKITDYVGATGTITVNTALTDTPSAHTFLVLGYIA